MVDVGGGQFRVSEGFRPYMTWKRFQRHVTQMRPIAADYTKTEYERVIVYEFFMPLTNETALRTTLDALFFKDNVVPKLKAARAGQLADRIPRDDGGGRRRRTWTGCASGLATTSAATPSTTSTAGSWRARCCSRDEAAEREHGGPALPRRRDHRSHPLHLPVRDRRGGGARPLLLQ